MQALNQQALQTVQFNHDHDRFDRNHRRGGVLGDADRDGVVNQFDRAPRNPRRH